MGLTTFHIGTNIFQVAAHELGHSLGLGHSSVRDSLMAPFYQKYKPKFKLHQDDVLAIQALYGVQEDESSSEPTPKSFEPDPSADGPDLCQDSSIDTVTRIADGSTYVFKGDYYWRIETSGIADGYPRKISTDWDGLPGHLDASLTWADGKTFFFKVTSKIEICFLINARKNFLGQQVLAFQEHAYGQRISEAHQHWLRWNS